MRDAKDLLEQGTKELSLDFDVEKGMAYLALLEKWNRAKNLTAITAPNDMVVKHLLDSLAISPYVEGKRILDVGSGGGLPGIPLAILFPEKEFTLIDSVGKKTRFLNQAATTLELSNVRTVQKRVESFHASAPFDVITSRAFSSLPKMMQLCGHLKAPGGVYLAMKAKLEEDEEVALELLVHQHIELKVPFLDGTRTLIKIK